MDIGLLYHGTKVEKFNFEDRLSSRFGDIDLIHSYGTIRVHKIILATRSLYFKRKLEDQPARALASISFRHVNSQIVQNAIKLIYGETIRVSTLKESFDFLEFLRKLQVDYWLKYDPTEVGMGGTYHGNKKSKKY